MVKKKVKKKTIRKVSKKVIKSKVKKTKSRSVPKKISKSRRVIRRKSNKLRVVLKNIVFFAILFILSVVLYFASSKELFLGLFYMLAILFGFIIIALLIVLFIFLILRSSRK